MAPRSASSGRVLLLAAALAWPLPSRAAPVPEILSVTALEDLPLPAPGEATTGFRLGGLSDLVADGTGPDGELAFWAVTDRGPNGSLTDPAVGDAPPKTRRTLPIPRFAPLLLRLSIPADGAESASSVRVARAIPLSTPNGKPVSGRPVAADPRAKPIVDPTTREPVPFDPDGFDTEGLARMTDGRFWVAEEYGPSLAEADASGTIRRRLVPRGVRIDGADCRVEDSLPARYVRRRDNRGFESLALSPDGTRLFALMQSPLEQGIPEATSPPVAPDLDVPLLVLDASSGHVLEEHAYRLGDGDGDTCDWCVASADGKVSAVAAIGRRALLVLEQSDRDLRLYRLDLPDGATPGPAAAVKSLVADLAHLADEFHRSMVPGATEAPARLSDLKFEGMAIVGPDRVALVNDNDFDIAPHGAAASSPPSRRTCLWLLRIPRALE